MLTVYIWKFRGKKIAWGHASIQVDQTYMSWWPEGDNRQRSKISSNIYSTGPFRYRTYSEDVEAEGQEPDHKFKLPGLNDSAVKDWWQSFGLIRDGILYQGPLQPWETLTMNCSTVAAYGITLAGGKEHAPWNHAWKVVWTPNDVLEYARAVHEGLKRN